MTHFQLLKENRLVKDLSLVQLINYFALMFTQVAIFTLLAKNGANPLELSFAAAIFWMPSILISPIIGVIVDMFSPKILLPLLISTEIICTLSFLGATDKDDYYVLMTLLFIRSAAGVAYYQTTMALLPKVISGVALQKANEIHSIIYSVCLTFGMALGGIIVHFFGIIEAFLIDAILYLIGLSIILRSSFPQIITKKERVLYMLVDGAKYLFSNKQILFIILIHSIVATTLFDAIVTLLAKNRYVEIIAIPLAIGFLNAIRSFGAMIGPFVIGNRVNEQNIGYVILIEGILLIIWAILSINFYSSLIGSFLTGFLLTTIWAYTITMIQKRVDERYYGRVIAYNDMFFTIVAVISSLFIGALLDSGIDERVGLFIIGILFLITGIFYNTKKEQL